MTSNDKDRTPLLNGPGGVAYVIFGSFFVGFGVLGAVLPVMPTTPFLLVASFFFVRSSPRLHAWLMRSPLFGPFLQDWHRHRGVRPRVKVVAIAVMVIAVTASIVWGNLSWPIVVLLLVLAAIGLTVVLRLPVIRDNKPSSPPSNEPNQLLPVDPMLEVES